MLATVAAKGVSPTTVRYSYTVLRIALGRALKQGKVTRNVATLVDAPKKARPDLQPLSGEQVRQLITATAEHRYGPLFALAISTGMRQGEILGLRWQDVDLEVGVVSVRHTLQEGSRELAEPKTNRGKRTLHLGAAGFAAVHEQRRRQLAQRLASGHRWRDADFVFASSIGSPLDARNVTDELQVALAAAGLPRQRFHDLRHAYATLMLEAGEDLAVVSRSLGHASITTTADVYAHTTPAIEARAAARMDAILGIDATA
jgi:integrase